MSKKIFSVTLKEVEVVEVDGEFKEIYKNEKKYPLMMTNLALAKGRNQGLINSSLLSDILQMESGIKGKKEEDAARDMVQDTSEEKMLNIIYLAFLGANPNTEYSFDGFVSRYHADYIETMTLYLEIIMSTITDGDNKFANGLKKSTKKPSAKEKK